MAVWKVSPPGKAEKHLRQLFEENKIPPDATPSSVKQEHQVFKAYSNAVFGKHFRRLRNEVDNRNGAHRKLPSYAS
jgi:hypothetical protein